jgi:hypothetical protein
MVLAHRYVVARENNVVRVEFRRQPHPPAPRFPGAAALRIENDPHDLAEGGTPLRQPAC